MNKSAEARVYPPHARVNSLTYTGDGLGYYFKGTIFRTLSAGDTERFGRTVG